MRLIRVDVIHDVCAPETTHDLRARFPVSEFDIERKDGEVWVRRGAGAVRIPMSNVRAMIYEDETRCQQVAGVPVRVRPSRKSLKR